MNYILFLLVNIIFIWKYSLRTAFSPMMFIAAWLISVGLAYVISCRLVDTKNKAKWSTIALLAFFTIAIAASVIFIDPLSINVDRWSALEYFIDGLFSGTYPYGIHTHVCETNFPSPFPLWQYIHIPFYFIGNVALSLIPFLFLFVFTVRWFTRSWVMCFTVVLLLALSPAYWWEVSVHSDGLSNAMAVLCLIMWMERCNITFSSNFIIAAIACGLAASTRLSAIIPMTIYCAKDFLLKTLLAHQFASLLIIVLIVFFFFAPYIFWDTESWVFFSRNPLMSQTSTGSPYVLLAMACIALWLAFSYNRDFLHFVSSTAVFLFAFFFISIVSNHIASHPDVSWMEDSDFDISYLTLSLPYSILSIASTLYNEQETA